MLDLTYHKSHKQDNQHKWPPSEKPAHKLSKICGLLNVLWSLGVVFSEHCLAAFPLFVKVSICPPSATVQKFLGTCPCRNNSTCRTSEAKGWSTEGVRHVRQYPKGGAIEGRRKTIPNWVEFVLVNQFSEPSRKLRKYVPGWQQLLGQSPGIVGEAYLPLKEGQTARKAACYTKSSPWRYWGDN